MLLLFPATVFALPQDPPTGEELQKEIQSQLDKIIEGLDISALQGQIDGISGAPSELTDPKALITKIATGNFRFLGADMLDFLAQSLRKPLGNALLLFSELLLLVVLAGILSQITKAFTVDGTAKVAGLIVYAAAAILIIGALSTAIKAAEAAVTGLLDVAQGIFPILSMLLAATGGFASTAILQPAYSVVVETASWLTKEVLIPAALYGGILAVVGNLTEKNLLSDLGSMLRNASVWIAGAVMTIFVAILKIQSSAAISYDGVSFRAAKYAVDSMVPYVGGMFSDMADTFVGCSLLVRNAVGTVGLLVLVAATIEPLLGIVGTYFAFRLASALAVALENKQLGAILGESSKVLMMLAVILLMSAMMLFFMMTISINAGNTILSMR